MYKIKKCPRCRNTLLIYNEDDRTYKCFGCGLSDDGKGATEIILSEDSRIHSLNAMAAEVFHDTLQTKYGKQAKEYLDQRNLSKATIDRFVIGYASNGKYLRLRLEKEGFSEDELLASGLYKEGKGDGLWFGFYGRIMFPICDAKGRVIGFSGRVMDDREPKYKNTPETEIFRKRENLFGFNLALDSEADELILCEGQMDVIAMHQAGFSNAVASLGTALTDTQAYMMSCMAGKVTILYDADTAGQKATVRAISLLQKYGLDVFVTNTLPCKDPDEFLRENSSEELQRRVNNADSALIYRFSHALNKEQPDYDEITGILLQTKKGEWDFLSHILK